MGARHNPKREKQIAETQDELRRSGVAGVEAEALFGHASADDLEQYSASMLAGITAYAAEELSRWDGETARVSVSTVEGVEPRGLPVSIVTVIDRNMPFLYDSIIGEVTSRHRDIFLAIHPILHIEDGQNAALWSADGKADAADRVSFIQIHLAPLTQDQADALIEALCAVLDQVHLSYTDWKKMLSVLDGATADVTAHRGGGRKAGRKEAVAFLDWLRDGNFIFLGMRDYTYSGRHPSEQARVERSEGRGLGILSNPDVLVLRLGKDSVTTTPEILEFLEGPDFLIVTKANVKSVVHRRAYMDYVGVKRFDADGNVVGELRIVGLFTATAYTHSVREIPLLRAKAEKINEYFGFDPASHSGRMLQNTLESYPRDDLFQIEHDLLASFCEQIMDLAERPRVRVLPRIDRFDRFVSVIVFVPREDYNSLVREKIGNHLASVYDGHVSAYYPAFPEGSVARVHFIIGRNGGKTPVEPQSRLEETIKDIAANWESRFTAMAGRHAPQLSVTQAFQEAFSPEETFGDLADISACARGERIRIEFYQRVLEGRTIPSLKIFYRGEHLPLSRRVPLLENLGFDVVSERTFDIRASFSDTETAHVVLHDMELRVPDGKSVDLSRQGQVLEEAFLAAFGGTVDNDSFNRLILEAGLSAREVTVLRAYARYLRQTGIVYSQNHIADTLAKYPQIAASLFDLFRESFDPEPVNGDRDHKVAERHTVIEDALSGVPSLDEDRTLRRYVNAIDATLRTNYFQKNADGKPPAMLAFKFDPALLDALPQPRPYREIFVYGVEVEGVHLRFGKVARGGLRWSDRGQDYRTEVLGLVKAQQVKNSVIVPGGAKGGFFPKALPSAGSRDEIFGAGREAYKTYIRTMLSITDNIEGNDIVPPANTLRLDGDDPYFVVAADKGTATFSDTANGLAQDAGFWLDDAFASGGSAGYDHKKMGITARGAWEAVKRHFREMDTDIQTTPFTVVGVGDMSGDVFGNGMLLSEKIRLLAAFDHRDIFIDPDPEPAASFAERKRMFDLPRSSWQDYDKALLSAGGMIISRAEKSVRLTAEAKAAIGIDKDVATPFEVMTAILKAPADLLWFGGIGTYIKAVSETDAEVGDRANDPIRVTAGEVRAKVIGEGANLGVTQKGRIAYCMTGGRCNTDAIDNSAGVNSSDVEVNIKIALASAMRDGRLTRPERNQLLSSMTDEVAALVLRTNYIQPLAISLTQRKGEAQREELGRLMSVLEAAGKLNRKVETLPDDATFIERYATGKPLTRPEISVLLAYAKIVLFDQLVASELPDDAYFADVLTAYFPVKMQEAYAGDIAGHRLSREIIATWLANETINRGGPGFVQAMTDATGASPADVVKAAMICREGLDFQRFWAATDALDNQVGGDAQNAVYARLADIFTGATRLMLQTGMTVGTVEEGIARLKSAAQELAPVAAGVIQRFAVVEDNGAVPSALASDITTLSALVVTPEIMLIAEKSGDSLERAAECYVAVTETFRVDRLMAAGQRIVAVDHYENLALARNLDQIATARRDIVIAALSRFSTQDNPVHAWHAADRVRVNRIGDELVGLSEGANLSLSRITVAAGLLSDLATGGVK